VYIKYVISPFINKKRIAEGNKKAPSIVNCVTINGDNKTTGRMHIVAPDISPRIPIR